MMFLNRLFQALKTSFVNASRTRVRKELLARDDRYLADTGFSRDLLELGNDAWPWRVDCSLPMTTRGYVFAPAGMRTTVPAVQQTAAAQTQATNELNTYTNAELSDLGISRTDIANAVRYGRPGLDQVTNAESDRKAA